MDKMTIPFSVGIGTILFGLTYAISGVDGGLLIVGLGLAILGLVIGNASVGNQNAIF